MALSLSVRALPPAPLARTPRRRSLVVAPTGRSAAVRGFEARVSFPFSSSRDRHPLARARRTPPGGVSVRSVRLLPLVVVVVLRPPPVHRPRACRARPGGSDRPPLGGTIVVVRSLASGAIFRSWPSRVHGTRAKSWCSRWSCAAGATNRAIDRGGAIASSSRFSPTGPTLGRPHREAERRTPLPSSKGRAREAKEKARERSQHQRATATTTTARDDDDGDDDDDADDDDDDVDDDDDDDSARR